MLTQEKVRKYLNYDHETGIFTRRLRSANSVQIGDIAGCVGKEGYVCISLFEKTYKAHRLAWLHFNGYFPENEIDHINRIKTDNSIKNLREISRSCNARNVGTFKNSYSGVKGVDWHGCTGKWRVRILFGGKSRHLGVYDELINAVCARLAAEQCLDWLSCDKASPAYKYVEEYVNVKP